MLHMDLFDTHAHLADEQLAADAAGRDRAGRRRGRRRTSWPSAPTARVQPQLPGTAPRSTPASGPRPAFIPTTPAKPQPGDWDEIVRLAGEPRVVALGETGLDLYWKDTPLPLQQDYFDRHIRLSQATGLPFIDPPARDAPPKSWPCSARRAPRGPLRGRHALVHRHGRASRRVSRPGPAHQLRRHGDVQEVGRPAGRRRHDSRRSHPGRDRFALSLAPSPSAASAPTSRPASSTRRSVWPRSAACRLAELRHAQTTANALALVFAARLDGPFTMLARTARIRAT